MDPGYRTGERADYEYVERRYKECLEDCISDYYSRKNKIGKRKQKILKQAKIQQEKRKKSKRK